MRFSAPWVMRSRSQAMPANGLKAEPVVRRPFEQGQVKADTNLSAPADWTAPQKHFPVSERLVVSFEFVTGFSLGGWCRTNTLNVRAGSSRGVIYGCYYEFMA